MNVETFLIIISFVIGGWGIFTLGRLYESVCETRKFLNEMERKMENRNKS